MIANQSGSRIHDLEYFEGKLNAISKRNRLMYFNEEFRPGFAGHMALLNLKTFVWPQFPGLQGTAAAAPYPPNSQVLDAVHAQGGVAGYVHPFTAPDRDPEEIGYSGAREFPVNAALGNVDYYDVMCIWSDEYVSAKVWYRVLNLGFRVPASAGTDAMTNYWRAPAIGTTRVLRPVTITTHVRTVAARSHCRPVVRDQRTTRLHARRGTRARRGTGVTSRA